MAENGSELLNTIYKEISEKLGMNTVMTIYQMFKGQQISFPIRFFNPVMIQQAIIQEYDGTNVRMLAIKYNYSEKTVRRIIKDSVEKSKCGGHKMELIGKLAKGAIKLAGSAALTATGVAATVVRQAGYVSGIDILADAAEAVQDASFEKIRDMWTPEDEKDDAYYDAQADRAVRRATSAASEAERFRKKYEKEKEKYNK